MTSIFVMRHGEKPNGVAQGVDEQGTANPKSLTPRGWQRAGALAVYFGSSNGLPIPDRIYASGWGRGQSNSQRSMETVIPLAAKYHRSLIQTYGKGEEEKLVKELSGVEGTTLVCWQHEMILEIARLLVQAAGSAGTPIPESWPADRFDVIWSFMRRGVGDAWTFQQICQKLLIGDAAQAI